MKHGEILSVIQYDNFDNNSKCIKLENIKWYLTPIAYMFAIQIVITFKTIEIKPK